MGDVIPTLFRQNKEQTQKMNGKGLAHCEPLCKGLLSSLNTRFSDYMSLSDIASVTRPYFKLRWMPQSSVGSVQALFLAKAVGNLETVRSSAAVHVPRLQSGRF